MTFLTKNGTTVLTPQEIQLFGVQAFFRVAPALPANLATTPFVDLGYAVVSNRAVTRDTFTPKGNRTGVGQDIRTFNKGVTEVITVYSKANVDEDILALHAGTAIVKGATGSGANAGYGVGVDGLSDLAAQQIGEFLLVEQSSDNVVKIAYYPVANIGGDGEATEDDLRYPQFQVNALAWGAWTPTPKMAPYVAGGDGTKVVLIATTTQLQAILDDIQSHPTS